MYTSAMKCDPTPQQRREGIEVRVKFTVTGSVLKQRGLPILSSCEAQTGHFCYLVI